MTEKKEGDETDMEHSDESGRTASFDHYDWAGSDCPSVAVAEAVAAVTNRAVLELPPIQEAVDADALDDVMQSSAGEGLRASFSYAGVPVVLSSDGHVEITVPYV